MVKITGKVFKLGTSYAVLIKKALVDAEVVKEGEIVELKLIERENEITGIPTLKDGYYINHSLIEA
jgi:hypothetical protein